MTINRAISNMTEEEAAQYENDLWATYHSLSVSDYENCRDVVHTLRLIGRVQQRRKELRDASSAN